ncbi:MAG: transposase [Planctomycetes bacterium]|nr:transposase [Planctomycetota bacterium]
MRKRSSIGNATHGQCKKKLQKLGGHLIFLDESGLLLLGTKHKTWGPRGDTPIVRYNYKHDRISALAALSVSAIAKRMGLYIRFQEDNFKAAGVARFLHSLLRHMRGNIILVWDNGRIHKGPIIAKLREENPRLNIEWFPGYAPELNPVEQIWKDFKGHSANRIHVDKRDLLSCLHNNKRRVARCQDKLRSFILSSELPSAPW